ncbi:c-type cytochrome domain-containing protein [Pedosphaera parvula]|uniref:WD-40 repeat protein n=1 Tax=Pedosphaera parvula (strain Ellin514) TaxID=320771 RepID=B9XH67_PEDPL|nr:c-type cytochrome domain-containing protein [Pedosphaera parvula]EEF60702.1 WD-40 repeat protein [Pedosphaera parvula Ellin514]
MNLHGTKLFLASSTLLSILSLICVNAEAENSSTNDYAAVDAIFQKHCLDCHGSQDPEGKLVLENFESLMKGGEIGAALVPSKSADSLLVQMIEGRFEKEGKKKIMPPGKRPKLDATEIAAIKAWIDAGAHGPPLGTIATRELSVPKIALKVAPRKPIMSLAYAPNLELLAVGRYGEVELRSLKDSAPRKWTGTGPRGNINGVTFSPDGNFVFTASGEPGIYGEVHQWKVADGSVVHRCTGHKDAIYALALSPDGKILATGSYDQKIILWNVETGKEIKTLSGHNGAIFGLAFRPDGKILASASADRTVKLWDVATGERRDTLSQPTKEVYAVAFSPDGKRLMAGGVDNRIRIWQISETAAETTNELLDSKFAHEGSILNLAFSSDGKTLVSSAEDRTVKLWNADKLTERALIEVQPDWVRAVTFVANDKTLVVGRMDGTIGCYDTTTGKLASDLTAQLEPAANAQTRVATSSQ